MNNSKCIRANCNFAIMAVTKKQAIEIANTQLRLLSNWKEKNHINKKIIKRSYILDEVKLQGEGYKKHLNVYTCLATLFVDIEDFRPGQD